MGQKSTTGADSGPGASASSVGPHYLALDHRPSHICTDLIDKVNWLRGHPHEASDMATRARAFALHHFNRPAILHDLASLLLGYHLVVTVSGTTTDTSSTTSTTTTSATSTKDKSSLKDKSTPPPQPLAVLPEVTSHLLRQFRDLAKTMQPLQSQTKRQTRQASTSSLSSGSNSRGSGSNTATKNKENKVVVGSANKRQLDQSSSSSSTQNKASDTTSGDSQNKASGSSRDKASETTSGGSSSGTGSQNKASGGARNKAEKERRLILQQGEA